MLSQERCTICLTTQTERLIPLSIHRHRLGKLGGATPYFFEFGLFCTFCMLFTMLIYSFWASLNYASDNWCKFGSIRDPLCGHAWKFYFSLVNKTEFDVSMTERALFFVNIVALLVLRVVFFRTSRNLERELDEGLIEITDYTVELVGVPRNANIREIFSYFQGMLVQSPDLRTSISVQPRAINLVFANTDVLQERDVELRKQLKEYGKQTVGANAYLQEIAKNEFLGTLHETENLLDVRFPFAVDSGTILYEDNQFCGKAYISFDSQVERNAVMNQMGMTGIPALATRFMGYLPGIFADKETGNGQQLRQHEDTWFHVGLSKHPADILWENQGLTSGTRLGRRVVSGLLILCIFAASFWTAFALKQWQISYQKGSFWVSLVLTAALKLFNLVFSLAAEFTAKFEKPETKTNLGSTLIWRNSTVG